MKPEVVIDAIKTKQHIMATDATITTNVSLSHFSHAVSKLDSTGSNWVVLFQSRFLCTMEQKEVYKHFDGTSQKPTLGDGASPTKSELKAHSKSLAAWQKKEQLACYLLIQKLLDTMYAKYLCKMSVAEMWEAIVTEFTHKSMYMQLNLHQEFMSMRSQKGADLCTELDRVCVKYKMLLNVGIEISDNNYHMLIINFIPPDISSVLAQMSLNMKQVTTSLLKAKVIGSVAELKGKLPNLVVEPEDMMQAALEEWDWREANKKSRQKATASTTSGTALAAVPSEKPGVKSSGGKRCCGRPGECWNCREKGHKKTDCPNPKDKSEKKDSEKSGGNSNKGKGTSSSSGLGNSSSNRNSSTYRKSNAGGALIAEPPILRGILAFRAES